MARRSKVPQAQLDLVDARVKTAPRLPAFRIAVDAWRDDDYQGASGIRVH